MSKDISNRVQEALRQKLSIKSAPVEVEKPADVKVKSAISEKMEGGKLYSELFNYVDVKGTAQDFYVPVYDPNKWDEESLSHIPQENNYIPDHSVLYPFMVGYVCNMKSLIVGPTGAGKTSLIQYVASKIRQPYLRINGRADMESDTLLGKLIVREGSVVFVKGDLPKAIERGWLVAFDEPWKTPSGIQMALQRLYERNGILQLDDMLGSLEEKQIKPDTKFRMVLCDNVVGTGDGIGQYGATMIQDSSTVRRMNLVLYQGYMDPSQEIKLLSKYGLEEATTKKMVQLANLLRTSFLQEELSCVMDTGLLETWAELSSVLGSTTQAFVYVMLHRYSSDSEKSAVKNLYSTVFGVSI